MAWIDKTYLDNAIGTDQAQALGLEDSLGALTARFDQYELDGRSTVLSVLQYAGYSGVNSTLTDSDDTATVLNAFLKKLAFAILIQDAYSMLPGISMSQELRQAVTSGLTMLEEVYQKRLPPPGMTPDTANGYGGSQFNTSGQVIPQTVVVFRTLRGSTF